MKIYALQNDSVDEICFRHYGRTRQAVEQVYAANPGLAEQGGDCLMAIRLNFLRFRFQPRMKRSICGADRWKKAAPWLGT